MICWSRSGTIALVSRIWSGSLSTGCVGSWNLTHAIPVLCGTIAVLATGWRCRHPKGHGRQSMQSPEPTPTIDLANYRIVRPDGTMIDLTPQEHRLLCALRQAGQLLTYEQIAQRAWGYECGYTMDGI